MRLTTTKSGRKAFLARRVVATLTLAAAATVGTITITVAPAQAGATDCSKIVRPQSVAAVCNSGTGYYRAWARCTNETTKRAIKRYGYWRLPDTIASNAACASNEWILSSASDTGIERATFS